MADDILSLVRLSNSDCLTFDLDGSKDKLETCANEEKITETSEKACNTSMATDLDATTSRTDPFQKICLSVLSILLFGTALFLSVRYCFQYTCAAAGGLSGGITLALLIAATVSRRARCVTALVCFGIFTVNGYTVLLSCITGLLLTGPILNTANNIGVASTVDQCSPDLHHNRSTESQKRVAYPQGRQTLDQMMNHLRIIVNASQNEMNDIQEGITGFYNTMQIEQGRMVEISKECANISSNFHNKCQAVLKTIERKCRENVAALDPSRAVSRWINNFSLSEWIGKQAPRLSDTFTRSRAKRGLDDLCGILKSDSICLRLNFTYLCPTMFETTDINKTLTQLVNKLNSAKDSLFDISFMTPRRSKMNPIRDLKSHANSKTLLYVLGIINILLSLMPLLMVFDAYKFCRVFGTRSSYESSVIVGLNKETAPLRSQNTYDLHVPAMHSTSTSSIIVLLHIIVIGISTSFDHLIYNFLQDFQEMRMLERFPFQSQIHQGVNKTRYATRIFNIASEALGRFSTPCLTNLTPPCISTMYAMACLYLAILVLIVLAPCGQRWRLRTATRFYSSPGL